MAPKVAFALNERLPRDIVIQQSEEVPADFHPRFAKTNKVYEYRILNRTFPDPLLSRYTFFFHRKLDEGLMDEEAQALVGEHDFTSFASIKSQTNTFVRTIHSISVKRDERGDQDRIDGLFVLLEHLIPVRIAPGQNITDSLVVCDVIREVIVDSDVRSHRR